LLKLCLRHLSVKLKPELLLELHCGQSMCNDWTLCTHDMPRGKLLWNIGAICRDWHVRCWNIFGCIGDSVFDLRDWDISTKRKSRNVCELWFRHALCHYGAFCNHGLSRGKLLWHFWTLCSDGHMRFGNLFSCVGKCLHELLYWEVSVELKPERMH